MKILPELKALRITLWIHGRFDEALPAEVTQFDARSYSVDPIPKDARKGQKTTDMVAYIFTSGTTGTIRTSWSTYT